MHIKIGFLAELEKEFCSCNVIVDLTEKIEIQLVSIEREI